MINNERDILNLRKRIKGLSSVIKRMDGELSLHQKMLGEMSNTLNSTSQIIDKFSKLVFNGSDGQSLLVRLALCEKILQLTSLSYDKLENKLTTSETQYKHEGIQVKVAIISGVISIICVAITFLFNLFGR